MARYLCAAVVATLLTTIVADIPKCGPGSPCPASAPCCSTYGQCGVGAYCLGGCDPLFSNTLKSCVPNPVCQSKDYQLNSLSDVQDISKYLGDASKANWVASGKPVVYNNDAILLTMAPDTVGTLMASTHYVWYGKISATLTTSQGPGVVTAFIMMSDVRDEIDFEFVGVDTQHAQSNYYSQGITNYNNGANLSVSNTVSTKHTYTFDWTPDKLTWSIDGNVMRTKNRADTWNATSNRFDYPQTPSRIMLSLWPAGLPSNSPGTIDWAGGLIDWNSPYMQNGYYYAMFSDVNVECYQPPSGSNAGSGAGYIYTDAAGTNNTISTAANLVVLKSLFADGNNPNLDPNAKASASGSALPKPSATPESVPGVSGAGTRNDNDGSSSSGSSGSSGNSGSSSASGGAASSTAGSGTFSQGSGSSGGVRMREELGGSVFAVLVAVVVALCW